MVAFRHVLVHIFTSDRDIAEAASKVLPVLACFNLFDSTVSMIFGVFRASGQQSTGAVLNFFTQVWTGSLHELRLRATNASICSIVWGYRWLCGWAFTKD